MNEPTFDADGYPTEETLDAIRHWEWRGDVFGTMASLLEFCQKAWHYPDYFIRGKRRYRTFKGGTQLHRLWTVHTGGWSGNEDIIAALREHEAFWMICFVEWRRGGHFKFETTEEA